MIPERPDPDQLLARIEKEQARARRGHLKIFFGAAAGVGKTFAMLMAARERRAENLDVVIGIVETHGRQETAALLDGLEVLPPRKIDYKGNLFDEFDLDAALKRRPGIILVDELAHSNVPGSRHPKRWQDIHELLEAGIDVYTALNVQHLESLNDDVNQISGIRVWETVPDTVFEDADEVELVDLPPDELLLRLKEGKVYLPRQAQQAIKHFFRKGNLIALRELALRQTANRVDAQMLDYREGHAIRDVWQVNERILVCIGPNDLAERLVRAGKRLASSLRAEWIVAYVETPQLQRLPAQKRDGILRILRLAEQLGAETVTLSATDMSEALIEFSRQRNINKIVIGKPSRRGWRRWLLGSVVDVLIAHAHNINIYLLGSPRTQRAEASHAELPAARKSSPPELIRIPAKARRQSLGYLWALLVTLLSTLAGRLVSGHLGLANLVMVYFLGVVFVAARFGRGPSIVASLLGVGCFDLLFVEASNRFSIADSEYLVTLLVMLLVGIVISNLTANVRSQASVAAHRERRAAALYAMSKGLSSSQTEDEVVRIANKHLYAEFGSRNVILFPDSAGRVRHPRHKALAESLLGADLSVAQWVFDHNEHAGHGTDTLPGAAAVYFPIRHDDQVLGVLALLPVNLRRVFLPEQQKLLETFLRQIAQAVIRIRFSEQVRVTQLQMEAERLRNSLLSAISHDLRSPLAAIIANADAIVDDQDRLSRVEHQQLGRHIIDEAERMTNLVNNILDMAKLEAGMLEVNKHWQPLRPIIDGVLALMQHQLRRRQVNLRLPDGEPNILVDAEMIEQVLINLLENAVRFAPEDSPLEISAEIGEAVAEISIADQGPGLPKGHEERLFDKFYQNSANGQGGVGLGLAICRAIVEGHGGKITAHNRPNGGAIFTIRLPQGQPG